MLASAGICEAWAAEFGEQAAAYVAEAVPANLVSQQRTEVVCPYVRVFVSHRFPPQQVDALVQHFRTAGEVVLGAFIVRGTHAVAIPVTPDPCTLASCPLDCSGDCGWDATAHGGGSCRWGRITDATDLTLSVDGCTHPPTSEPTAAPTGLPTADPTTSSPTTSPSRSPTFAPTPIPSAMPTLAPTRMPSAMPTTITLPTIVIPFVGASLVASEAEALFKVRLLANVDARWQGQGHMINLDSIRVLLSRHDNGVAGLEAVLQFSAASSVDIAIATELAAILADDPLSFTLGGLIGDGAATFTSASAAAYAWSAPTPAPPATLTATPVALSTMAPAEATTVSAIEAPGVAQQSKENGDIPEPSTGALVVCALAVAVILSLCVAVVMRARRKNRRQPLEASRPPGQHAVARLGSSPGMTSAGGSQSSFGVILPTSGRWLPVGGDTYVGMGQGFDTRPPTAMSGMSGVTAAHYGRLSPPFEAVQTLGQMGRLQPVVSLDPTAAMFTNRLQPHAPPIGVAGAPPDNRWGSGQPTSVI